MKTALLFMTMAFFFLFSCKMEKSNEVKPVQKNYKVTFSVSNFKQSISNAINGKTQVNGLRVDSSTTNMESYATVLHLCIFDNQGKLIRKLEQVPGVSNYGIISDSLTAGTYTVVADAGQNQLKLAVGPQDDQHTDFHKQNLQLADGYLYSYSPKTSHNGANNEGVWYDTFYKKFQLIVTNAPIDQPITLERVVGKLEVNFNSVIPQNAARVDMLIRNEFFEYNIGSAQPVGTDSLTTSFVVPDSVKGTANFKFSQIILNTTVPFNITLTAYDSSNKIISAHAANNVSCQVNKRTILTGSFSNGSSGNGLSISTNSEWGVPTTIHY